MTKQTFRRKPGARVARGLSAKDLKIVREEVRKEIKATPELREIGELHDLVAWCIEHNVFVRFNANKTVEVTLNGIRRIRKTLREAIEAHGEQK